MAAMKYQENLERLKNAERKGWNRELAQLFDEKCRGKEGLIDQGLIDVKSFSAEIAAFEKAHPAAFPSDDQD